MDLQSLILFDFFCYYFRNYFGQQLFGNEEEKKADS